MNSELQLFAGEASDAEARVYAMLQRTGLPDDAQLAGDLVGPFCRYSQTLPARIRFVDRGPGATLLAEAVVPDPCFWTPELPFMYSAELRLSPEDTGRVTTSVPTLPRRLFGIRRLGVHAGSLYQDAKRFVIRGVRRAAPTIEELQAAREASSALYIEAANDRILQEASEEGVLLVVRIGDASPPGNLIGELARVGRWPAAAVVVLDAGLVAGNELRLVARNTLLAQRFTEADVANAPLRPWAHLVWWELAAGQSPLAHLPQNVPVVVFRPGSEAGAIGERRQNCDQLQADLAPQADFAGYFV